MVCKICCDLSQNLKIYATTVCCTHKLHWDCLKLWNDGQIAGGLKETCPVCRGPFKGYTLHPLHPLHPLNSSNGYHKLDDRVVNIYKELKECECDHEFYSDDVKFVKQMLKRGRASSQELKACKQALKRAKFNCADL